MKPGVPFAVSILVAALAAGSAAGQPARDRGPAPADADLKARAEAVKREEALKDAITAEPGDLKRYLALADFYKDDGRPDQADSVLRLALKVDPGATYIFDQRLALFLKPLSVSRIGSIALDWLVHDPVNPVPVLLAAGHHLRAASATRGDGSTRSERAIEEGLRIVDGALPINGNREVAALLFARSALLMAHSTLVSDAARQKKLVEEAQALHQQATEPPPIGVTPMRFTGSAAAALGVMSIVPPFGPPGAVRAPGVVPVPKKLKGRVPSMRDRRTGRPPRPLLLELVIDEGGHVLQIHILESSDGYEDVVADAVQTWEYEPTLIKGQPQKVIMTTSVSVW